MTSPQPDPQQDDNPTAAEAAVIAALMVWFASVAAVSATLLPPRLVGRLTDLGLEPRAVRAAGRLAMAPPLTGRGRYGSPTAGATATALRQVKADEPLTRARYVLNAAKRLTKALLLAGKRAATQSGTQGQSGTSGTSDEAGNAAPKAESLFAKAVRLEAQYMDQQRAAGQNRARAAKALDQAAAEAGPDGKLRWVAILDSTTTPDCAALHGTLFTLDKPPRDPQSGKRLTPGAVHPRCRCKAVPAYDSFRSDPVETVSAS